MLSRRAFSLAAFNSRINAESPNERKYLLRDAEANLRSDAETNLQSAGAKASPEHDFHCAVIVNVDVDHIYLRFAIFVLKEKNLSFH